MTRPRIVAMSTLALLVSGCTSARNSTLPDPRPVKISQFPGVQSAVVIVCVSVAVICLAIAAAILLIPALRHRLSRSHSGTQEVLIVMALAGVGALVLSLVTALM